MPAVNKMVKATGLARDIVERLVGAGYTTPGKVQDATNRHLLAISGIGQAQLETIRAILPKR